MQPDKLAIELVVDLTVGRNRPVGLPVERKQPTLARTKPRRFLFEHVMDADIAATRTVVHFRWYGSLGEPREHVTDGRLSCFEREQAGNCAVLDDAADPLDALLVRAE